MPNKLNMVIKPNKILMILLLMGMQICSHNLHAQITIGGDIYGGGNKGAVGTGNLADGITNETAPESVVFKADKSTAATSVTINGGTVRTVFGGGRNGRTYGSTSVAVNSNETSIGGTVGNVNWTGTIHGGLFGAGDGESAYVFGNSSVTVEAGTIYQNIYGGGNQAELGGNTSVVLRGGDLRGSIFGGARMADIQGYSDVFVDATNIKTDLVVNYIYGGNDISGSINGEQTINGIITNTYVHTSAENESADKHIFVGQLYAGGNGDYHNSEDNVYTGGELTMVDVPAVGDNKETTISFSGLSKPELPKGYIDIQGGTFGYVFGGGNFATVTKNTEISLNNASTPMSIDPAVLSNDRLMAMGLNPETFKGNIQFNRVFGGNNKVDMAIRPVWHLTKGSVYDLYSGGNEGGMTSPNGIFLPIESAYMVVENVYGGCRKADVNPGTTAPKAETLNGHEFQADYAARVLVTAGKIKNVYGGNDVSGTVYHGTDLQILGSIDGEVYGGGNGSYVYTDNANLSNHLTYGDLYYAAGSSSVESLNAFRPQTEKSYIHVAGTPKAKTTISKVFGGGNSATVTDAIHLQIGENVTVEDVFLGSNGANMVDASTLDMYKNGTVTVGEASEPVNTMDFTDQATFDTYMLGAAVDCMPTYAFDSNYYKAEEVNSLARIGSFFGGGNVGSMTSADAFEIAFDKPIIITKKLVGGCNAANVAASDNNVKHVGGITGESGTSNKIFIDANGIIFDVNPVPEELSNVGAGNQGNIFGGCFESGIVNGNVGISVQKNLIPDNFFADGNPTKESYLDYSIPANAGNVFATPLTVFGGGYGKEATIEGNTTVDFSAEGGALKVFGGGYGGSVNGHTTVNFSDNSNAGKLYGGGFEGPVSGNTMVNLDGGTAYDVIGGACNADVVGHTEVYIGTNGFPTVINNVYGANDFGGRIQTPTDFFSKVSPEANGMVYNNNTLKASAYIEYNQGSVNYIFGGAKASYDYNSESYKDHVSKYPHVGNAFVNFKPSSYNASNKVARVYGAGQGYAATSVSFQEQNEFQDQSYVLIDIPQDMTYFQAMEVFGSGDASGLGMGVAVADASKNSSGVVAAAVVDLVRGQIGGQNSGAYGGSFRAGVTRRTIVNVPEGSTITMNSLYGGAYGQSNTDVCDVYEANVNYHSEDARLHYIYGGNNNYRRTLYGFVNVTKPVQYMHEVHGLTTGSVYGGGYGQNSWSQYTEVNLNDGAEVWEVFGGGYGGDVLNKESITEKAKAKGWSLLLGGGYDADTTTDHGGLDNPLANVNQLFKDYGSAYAEKSNANVHIHKGAIVKNYAYGGGYGQHITVDGEATTSATVSGTCYIDLLGGTVEKDLYAAGTTGAVKNLKHKYSDIPEFTASATAYIKGGTARNVYGGGWEGPVGYHPAGNDTKSDILGVTNVVIGLPEGTADADFYNGIPVVRRNAYGGGEGGPVFGTSNISLYNGYVGYRYEDGAYVPDLDMTDPNHEILFKRAGNIFGAGFARYSDVDIANVKMYGGHVRNSLYGGGEIGAVGRGSRIIGEEGETIEKYKAGETHVIMYGGHVEKDVFGGGRGFNNWGTEEVPDDNTNGYIFGTTDVRIHRGEIGTAEGVAEGVGNVFGGGNIGFVYSVNGVKQGVRGDGEYEGWYYTDVTNKTLSEDTHVEVKVWGKALGEVNIGGKAYAAGAYIETEALNQLKGGNDDRATWANIDQTGVTIHNAVFAGGNVSAGTDKVMAFANTVYGNSTASVVDAFSRDLVTVGADGVGGLYGDGNLTFVDGYRELNITNYGTDFYYLDKNPTSEYYAQLTDRQKSFYVTKYTCKTDYDEYMVGDVIMSEEYNRLPEDKRSNWQAEKSIINEGRYINTVQRCDFCGIKGSRLVLRGAIDRAQDETEADYTHYTINRVGELSLNQNKINDVSHGCYFGIYNVVKLLGSVTSDVHFAGAAAAIRQTGSTTTGDEADGVTTYYKWKQDRIKESNRNNGTSPNKIALASGVFMELVKGFDNNGNKIYGPVTGVIELDLLNVSPGEGGGYVYAQNIHGKPSYTETYAKVLSSANKNVITNRAFEYAAATAKDKMQTSGNFIHSMKRIVDDCYPKTEEYVGKNASPAHYWYIRGEFYIYEQLVSAYTGAAEAYSTEISIPLTLSVQGNAKLRLLNIVPGLYADPSELEYSFDAANPDNVRSDSLSLINNSIIKTYGQGDPISYWDWYMASTTDRKKFITDGYYCNYQITVGSETFYPGQAVTTEVYNRIKDLVGTDDLGALGEVGGALNVSEAFSLLNEVDGANGYVLSIDYSNPSKWDDYYTLISSTSATPIKKSDWEKLSDSKKETYVKSATFTCNADGTYGQRYFKKEAIISESVHKMQTDEVIGGTLATQAEFDTTYIAKEDCEVYINGMLVSVSKGMPICKADYDSFVGDTNNANNLDKNLFDKAYICVSTVLVAEGDYRVLDELVPYAEWNSWDASLKDKFQPAYYCVKEGSWGGRYYKKGNNYNGVDFCQLLPEERKHFSYNFDALDALLYKKYDSKNGYAYNTRSEIENYVNTAGGTNRNPAISVFDNNDAENSIPQYSRPASLDYTATYHGSGFKYVDDKGTIHTISTADELKNVEFESLPNDRKNYAQFSISDAHLKGADDEVYADGNYHTFIVKETFDVAGVMYNAGKSITAKDYSDLSELLQKNVQEVIITKEQYHPTDNNKFYFCINPYTVYEGVQSVDDKELSTFHDLKGNKYEKGSSVELGTIINSSAIISIPNCQVDFDVQGETPIEEATLYVPVSADINALQKDRYLTAIYEYTYTECDDDGSDYETRVEKHIINLRVKFLSGNPVIGQLDEPDLILPLEPLALEVPPIQEGAFPILSGGWEIYANESDANRHRNGHKFLNNIEPLYFYENGYWVAYYAETRLGKTFSDPVQVKVANYQRMSDVITDPNHMHINHRDNDRDPKIYIGNNIFETGTDTYSSELDALHKVFNITNTAYGTAYNVEVNGIPGRDITGAKNLDFYLSSDIEYGGGVASWEKTWTPIGNDIDGCFGGRFHGNGRTISGLDNSIFGKLCGEVYNTGVMGTFTAGGIANTGEGRVENCWVWTTGTPDGQAVYAKPEVDAVILNSYYPDANAFTGSDTELQQITKRTVEDFVNGAVAYDLNRYYLEARYRLFGNIAAADTARTLYRLPDGTKQSVEKTDEETGDKYLEDVIYEISYPETYNDYVTKYYSDGDFRFAQGLKPTTDDLRYNATAGYLPLYPDDYLFFGQKLTYGLLTNNAGNDIAHEWHPVAIAKTYTTQNGDLVDNSKNGLLINDIANTSANRVYRAPAYFRTGTYGRSAMFNAHAVFTSNFNFNINGVDYTTQPHAQMTAIDFTGANGDTKGYQGAVAGLPADFKDRTSQYAPLLDYERLDAIRTSGLTQNLLAYTPSVDIANTKNTQTHDVLVGYFRDLAYAEDNTAYRTVAIQKQADIDAIKGHAVLQATTSIADGETDYTYATDVDHFLVDKQDFNAPIAYGFAADKRMWYQREPENYVEIEWSNDPTPVRISKGWIGISLPFDAELVTTQTKGELTHFYDKQSDKFDRGYESGHEYWLRRYEGGAPKEGDANIYEATFGYPEAAANEKQYTNTFLWDYYYQYSGADRQDENTDDYQQKYYAASKTYTDYPYSQGGMPYIVGLPGSSYYEFDLSGSFVPAHSLDKVEALDAQIITFASPAGGIIGVSDQEMNSGIAASTHNGYVFTPNYLNATIDAGAYVLNAEGSSYELTDAQTPAVPFRPYFAAAGSGVKEHGAPRATRAIAFNSVETGLDEEQTEPGEELKGQLHIFARRGRIYVKSGLLEATEVRIVNTAGSVVRVFTIQPGQTIETQTEPGIYIVNKKKLSVGRNA